LLSIARFKALSARRRRSDAECRKKSRNEVLRQAVMKLSPDHREIIDLVYYHEKSMIARPSLASRPRP
jgi:RNA polymerase sigma-70 factor (ECF subfamily)